MRTVTANLGLGMAGRRHLLHCMPTRPSQYWPTAAQVCVLKPCGSFRTGFGKGREVAENMTPEFAIEL